MWNHLGRRERDDVDVDGVPSLVEQVRRNPGGGDVGAGRRRLVPARRHVERVEADGAMLVQHLDLRDDRSACAQDPKGDLDADRVSDVDRAARGAVLVDDAHRLQSDEIVARRGGRVVPDGARPGAHGLLLVVRDDVVRRPLAGDLPVLQEKRSVAKLEDRVQVVRDEQNRPAGLAEALHAAERPPLEVGVADGEHFVHDHDVGLEVGGYGEGEPNEHPARVALHGSVHELLDP